MGIVVPTIKRYDLGPLGMTVSIIVCIDKAWCIPKYGNDRRKQTSNKETRYHDQECFTQDIIMSRLGYVSCNNRNM